MAIHPGAASQQAAGFERQQAAAVRGSDGWGGAVRCFCGPAGWATAGAEE
ncbi:MAG TPA: hypothetical protein VGE67_18805 [Haloferula sp.]